jgi:hypothetical protein
MIPPTYGDSDIATMTFKDERSMVTYMTAADVLPILLVSGDDDIITSLASGDGVLTTINDPIKKLDAF